MGVKNCDAGHFVGRTHTATLYHPNNSRPQCHRENRFQQGAHFEYRIALIDEIGEDAVKEIEALARTRGDDSIAYHNSIEKEYKAKVMELQERLGVKYW